MNDGLIWDQNPTVLNRPVLVAAFEGWNDASEAATSATDWLTRIGSERLASIDPQFHFDFQTRRPQVSLAGGVTRGIVWPENTFSIVRGVGGANEIESDSMPRDFVILRGIEPSYHWKSFCRAILGVATTTGCEMVVTMGALLADVPHSRNSIVSGSATDPDLTERLGLTRSTYEGPTGIVGVLHDQCRAQGIPSVSLWSPVPQYVASPPNPPATLGLLDRFESLCAVDLYLNPLRQTVIEWRRQIDQVVSQDDDVRHYVTALEERFDAAATMPSWGENLPTEDELGREVEEFLRKQSGE